MGKNLFKNLVLLLSAVSIFFLSVEATQRIRFWKKYDSTYWLKYGFAPKPSREDYYRMQLHGLYRVRQAGIVRIPRIFYEGYSKFDPDYPHAGYSVNSLGFRNYEFSPEKIPGTCRIAVIGDSTVFGLDCQDKETFPAALEARLRRHFPDKNIEVLNLGIPSFTSENMKNLVKSEVLRYSPDMVIIYGFINDIYYSEVMFRKERYFLTFINSFLLDHSVFYLSLREKMCLLLEKDIGELYRGSLVVVVKNLMNDNSIMNGYRKNMGEIINAAKQSGADVVIVKQAVYLTGADKAGGILMTDIMKPYYDRFYAVIDDIGRAHSVEVISVNKHFGALSNAGAYFAEGDGVHFNPSGNDLLAEMIFEEIKDKIDKLGG